MNMIREGGSTTRSPVLDGTSYVYFMIAFLKFINNKIWKAVAIGWEHPFVTDVEGKVTPKPEIEWTTVENEASLGNSRVLNVIFNSVGQNVFKLINTCTSSIEALRILEIAYEGTSN